jgi:hypothetical protein
MIGKIREKIIFVFLDILKMGKRRTSLRLIHPNIIFVDIYMNRYPRFNKKIKVSEAIL